MGWNAVLLMVLVAAALFAITTAAVVIVLLRLPADYFCRACPAAPSHRHSVVYWAMRVGKNLAGLLVVALGIVLLLPGVPGQGLLVILLGVALLDFPGKRRLERSIVGRPHVRQAINWLRARYGKPPLVPDAEGGEQA